MSRSYASPFRLLLATALGVVSVGGGLAHAQWVDFVDATNTNLDMAPVSLSDPLEKDIATADLNQDGWIDAIVARKVRFSNPGAITDILLINEEGVLVNRTADLAPGFLTTPTDARDVIMADVDMDGWVDVIFANTFGEPPRLYRNLGNNGKGVWLGLADETFRFPVISINGPLQFCALWAGDVTGNGAPDIYFSNYGGALAMQTFDVLLINDGNGFFTDETEARLRGPLGDFSSVGFGTSVEMHDVDNDGDKDIIKISTLNVVSPWGNTGVFLLFNDGNGFFNAHPFQSISPDTETYMFTAGDLNEDGMLDFFFQNDGLDLYRFVTAATKDGPITFGSTFTVNSPRLNGLGGNTKFADVDGDGDLDLGVASVDTDIQNCDGNLVGEFALVRNDSGVLTDIFAEVSLPWHLSCFDFSLADFSGDGLADLLMGNCDGYKLFIQTDPFFRDCNFNGTPDGIDILSGPLDQWASSVIDFSSQQGADAHSADRALGEPDTFAYGENETAWSPAPENGSPESLTLGFDAPVFATGVTIRETEGNGFVFQVDAVGIDDAFTTVWSGADPSLAGDPVDFDVAWPETDFAVKGLRIHVDTDHDPGREAIDAAQLHGRHVATSEDLNGDATPDECECAAPPAPFMPEQATVMNRFLPFEVGFSGEELAVRVLFDLMPESHSELTGTTGWVGTPRDVTEIAGSDDTTPPTFKVAPLQCEPVFVDWSQFGPIHVYHRNIVPGARYQIQLIGRDCSIALPTNFSIPLAIESPIWGDLTGRNLNDSSFTSPDGSVDIVTDVLAAIGKFGNIPGALAKARVDVSPETPDFKIDILDINRLVNAFVGLPFPFTLGPDPITGGPPCED